MKHSLFDRPAALEMLDHDSLQQFRGDGLVPHAFWIHDDDRAFGADAEAWRFAALHARGAEEQSFPLEQTGQLRIKRSTPTIG